MGFLGRLCPVEEALEKTLGALSVSIGVEEVNVDTCVGRVSAEDVRALFDVPAFDRSAVDGYAVRAEDTFGASPSSPIELRIIGDAGIGDDPSSLPTVNAGEALELPTGAPLPPGANAVVMREDAVVRDDVILVLRPVPVWANVSRRGEDFRKGDNVISRGTIVKPWHIGALASFGFNKIRVYRRVRVAVFSTGDEVVEPGEPLRPGQVYNSTGHLVLSYLSQYPFVETRYLGIVPDDKSMLKRAVKEALAEHDVLITTGGTGVSSGDVVPSVIKELGSPGVIVRGVAMRPGRPTSIGVIEGKPVFMLSGFPVAALAGLDAIVIPVLHRMLGAKEDPKPAVRVKLTRRVVNAVGYRSYVRVRVFKKGGEVYAEPLRLTGSGILSTLVRGNGLLVLPENLEGYEAGELVDVVLLNPVAEEVE